MAYTGQNYGSDTDTIPTLPAVLAPAKVPWWLSLHDGRYKYVRTLIADEVEELYDLETDPGELVNLARRPEHGERVQTMRERLIEELRSQGAGMADQLPPVADLPGTAEAKGGQ